MGGGGSYVDTDPRNQEMYKRDNEKRRGFEQQDLDEATKRRSATTEGGFSTIDVADVAAERLKKEAGVAENIKTTNLEGAEEERKKRLSASSSLAGASTVSGARALLTGGAQ
jgi:hypothetical protein